MNHHHGQQQQQQQHTTTVAASLEGVEIAATETNPSTQTDGSSMNHILFSSTSKYHPEQEGLARRRRWLVVDYDGTCTEHDTTPLLPRLAAFATRQRRSVLVDVKQEGNVDSVTINNTLHVLDLERRMRLFQQLESEYLRRYSEAKSSLFGTKEEETQHQSIHEMLDALDEPSTIVTQMVSESRVLEGLGHVDAEELGRIVELHSELTTTTTVNNLESSDAEIECARSNNNNMKEEEVDKVVVRLRPGCQRTLSRILSENCDHSELLCKEYEGPPSCWGWNIAVLSINWCPALIDASIVQPVLKQRRSVLQIDTCTTEIPIWSNQVNVDGVISLHIPGASAKRDRIVELRRNIHHSSDDASVIVYVGDSSTDLAALLEADIGIIMGQRSIAEQWGIQIVPLKHRCLHDDFDMIASENFGAFRKHNILWQAESWMEIDEMLRELDAHWS